MKATRFPDLDEREFGLVSKLLASVSKLADAAERQVQAYPKTPLSQGRKGDAIRKSAEALSRASTEIAQSLRGVLWAARSSALADLGFDHTSDGSDDDTEVIDRSLGNDDNAPALFDVELVESENAYDDARLNSLGISDIQEAIDYETEFKDLLGFAWVDDEAREAFSEGLAKFVEMSEDGNATVAGMVARTLKAVAKNHRRGFARYYSGKDPWPRPSTIVQAEIDERLPFYMRWLTVELEEALKAETSSDKDAG